MIPSSRVNHGAVLDNKARIIIFGGYTVYIILYYLKSITRMMDIQMMFFLLISTMKGLKNPF